MTTKEAFSSNTVALDHSAETRSGSRFEFGRNWEKFLSVLNDDRIHEAERSLLKMLDCKTLSGKRFLDIGSGSGLFSLAARRLGATVVSFDYDTQSVACTTELRRQYFPSDPNWTISQGSILDAGFIDTLGPFDVVYSWGVLHHTGDMWTALENAATPVAIDGKLFIAIYNDVGSRSRRWRFAKSLYCRLPAFCRTPYVILVSLPEELKRIGSALMRGKPKEYVSLWTDYKSQRGMNRWYDIVDWVGGYPYEYAGPSALFEFFSTRGFSLTRMSCDNVGLGCNELVFQRTGELGKPCA